MGKVRESTFNLNNFSTKQCGIRPWLNYVTSQEVAGRLLNCLLGITPLWPTNPLYSPPSPKPGLLSVSLSSLMSSNNHTHT